MPFIIEIIAFVNVPTSPCKDSCSSFFVLFIFSIVNIAILVIAMGFPFTSAVLQPFLEFSDVYWTRSPFVFAFAVRFSIKIFSSIHISCIERVCPLTMLQAHVPLPLIPVSVWPCMDSVTMSLRGTPLADVRITPSSLPDAISLLETLVPLAIINLSIFPSVDSLTMGLAILELAKVSIAIGIPFESFSVPQISIPKAFVLPSVPVPHDSFPVPFPLDDSAHINGIFIFHFFVPIYLLNCDQIHFIRFKYDVPELRQILLDNLCLVKA